MHKPLRINSKVSWSRRGHGVFKKYQGRQCGQRRESKGEMERELRVVLGGGSANLHVDYIVDYMSTLPFPLSQKAPLLHWGWVLQRIGWSWKQKDVWGGCHNNPHEEWRWWLGPKYQTWIRSGHDEMPDSGEVLNIWEYLLRIFADGLVVGLGERDDGGGLKGFWPEKLEVLGRPQGSLSWGG